MPFSESGLLEDGGCGILSSKQVKKSEWAFTCEDCHWLPVKDSKEDWVRSNRISKRTGARGWIALHYPVRCTSCNTLQRRYQRMNKRLEKIWKLSFALDKKYSRPKLITFALPSIESLSHNGESEIAKLNKQLPKARKVLEEYGVLGGTFVLECTTRLIWTDLTKSEQMWKHHAHVHMVGIAPFMQRADLKKFSECLLPLGLGRINYVAPSGKWRDAKAKVAAYISKYLVKDNRSSRTWGIMRIKNRL